MFLLCILYIYFFYFTFELGDNSKFSFRGSELSVLWSEISFMERVSGVVKRNMRP